MFLVWSVCEMKMLKIIKVNNAEKDGERENETNCVEED